MTMHCEEGRATILGMFDQVVHSTDRADLDAHVANCSACTEFVAQQERLDRRLTASVLTPPMNPYFRQRLRARTSHEDRSRRLDPLPDIVHFATCGAATVVCASVLPVDTDAILVVGATAALLSYIVLVVARGAFEDGAS
jgi:hypothetical protein